MNEIQLTDHLTARISAEGTCGRYRARIYEDGDFRESLYAMSLKRLKRKCEKYANRPHPTRMISRQNSSNHCSEFSVKTLNSA